MSVLKVRDPMKNIHSQKIPVKKKKVAQRSKHWYAISADMGIPYIVYITNQTAVVYGIPKTQFIKQDQWIEPENTKQYRKAMNTNRLFFHEKIITFEGRRILIGKNLEDAVYDGNTILIDLGEEKYVYISENIYLFVIPKNDKILKFFSRLANGIPYTVAVGKKNVYFLDSLQYVPRKHFSNFHTQFDWSEKAGRLFYGKKSKFIPEKRDLKIKLLHSSPFE